MALKIKLVLICLLLIDVEGISEPTSSFKQTTKWFHRLRRPQTKGNKFSSGDEIPPTTMMTTITTAKKETDVTDFDIGSKINESDPSEFIARPSPLVGTGVLSLLHSTDLVKFAVTGVQCLLGWYLLKSVWKAATEVLEDLQLDQTDVSESSFLSPSSIQQILLDLQENKCNESPTFRTAQKLYQAGFPLCHDRGKSVKSILLGLTKTELHLLQTSLYTPPSSDPHQLWTQIKGLSNVQEALLDRISSMRYCPEHHPYAGILGASSPGILLYGPPGCGKSLLIQALSTTARMPCLMITPSTLLRKYVGETNILIRALWKLAEKLSPCIMLLDELDGLFRERRGDEHDVSRESKTEFLQWWDGVSKHNQEILVIGATNRPFDVDAAVLRRMPQSHFCGLPMATARLETLQSLIQKIPHDAMDLSSIVGLTEGYSPSDLVQIVQTAVQSGPLREARYQGRKQGYRALALEDLMKARQAVGPTPLSPSYRHDLIEYTKRHSPQQIIQVQAPQNEPEGMQDGGEWGSFYHAGTFEADLDGPGLEEETVESDWSEHDSHEETEGFDADL